MNGRELNSYSSNCMCVLYGVIYFLLGMWADDSDEDERPGFGGHGMRNSKDYSAPIGFVSGGVKVGDKVTKNENPDDEEVKKYVFSFCKMTN